MANKKASDFRYNTGETKVPWAAVGENYNVQDIMAFLRFMMQGKGDDYEALMGAVEGNIRKLDEITEPPAKLSMYQLRAYRQRLQARQRLPNRSPS